MNEPKLPMLPPRADLESRAALKQLARANRALAELKGYASTIPNQHMLINAVMIKEAKDSSAIENIITTHDDLYRAMSNAGKASIAAKEVVSYREALWHGYQLVRTRQVLTTSMIIEIQEMIEKNTAGLRKLPGTVLRNEATGEIVYTPPATEHDIKQLLANLETYINEDDDDVDHLIKLAVLHYQFEVIHPFYDGNGRTGRIVNVLYLVLKGLLESPILYLSSFIIRNKPAYYRLLQEVRTHDNWEEWILYILTGIEQTAAETLFLIRKINQEAEAMSAEIQARLPKIYSQELMSLLFYEFYTKTHYIEKGLAVTRKTAVSYLSALEREGFLSSERIGKERIYLNRRLYELVRAGQ